METPKRAMVIVAHCDDAEFMCAGTIAKWAREGFEVMLVVCTDSSKGSEDPEMSPWKLTALRIEEQRASAKILGIQKLEFLGHTDGELEDNKQLRRELVRLIRTFKPQRVVCMDPTMRYSPDGYVNHPDHIAAANAALAAVYPFARNRPTFPELLAEGLEPYSVPELYMSGWSNANCWIDISDTIELKIEALKQHKSQFGDWNPEEMIRDWARRSGTGQLLDAAESFKLLKLD